MFEEVTDEMTRKAQILVSVSPLEEEKVEVRILGSPKKMFFRKIILEKMERLSLMMNKNAVNISEVRANSSGFRHQFL